MIVTVWRHGKAGQASEDRLRELTPRGQRDIPRGAQSLLDICERRNTPVPDALWYSRWQRTWQTAERIADVFTALAPVSEEALIPGCSPQDVERALERLWQGERLPEHLVLVSHQPLVSHLVDYLTGEPGASPSQPPGGLVTLSLNVPAASCATLLWWAFPPDYEAHA